MYCLHCGAALNKNDILCLRCGTPVLTEDDITLMPNAVTTRYINEVHSNTGSIPKDSLEQGDSTQLVGAVQPVSNVQIKERTSPQRDMGDYDIDLDDDTDDTKVVKRRKTIIIASIIIGVILLGVVLFVLLQPNAPWRDDSGTSNPPSGDEEAGSEGDASGVGASSVTAINIYSGNRIQTEFHAMVGETILLGAQIVPADLGFDIKWESSDPDVLEVTQLDPGGSEASITGKTAGVADIIVTADGFEVHYVVFVDSFSMRAQLETALENDETTIWLTITWQSGPNIHSEVLFERDVENGDWFIDDSTERVEASLAFVSEVEALTMTIDEYPEVFHFLANGTGHVAAPDGAEEIFSWWFTIYETEAEG